jgi:hypothetical protein
MQEMSDDELRTAIDAICARMQSDLQGQMAQLEARHRDARDAARNEAEARTAQLWSGKLDAARHELESARQEADARVLALVAEADHRVQSALAQADSRLRDALAEAEARWQGLLTEANAQADRRVADEAEKATFERQRLESEANDRLQQDLARTNNDWHLRLQAELAQAAQHADRRVADEAEKAAFEVHRVQTEWAERLQLETTQARDGWEARLRQELAEAAADADRRVTVEAEKTTAEIQRVQHESAEHLQRELARVSGEWDARLQAEHAQAGADADRRVAAEAEKSSFEIHRVQSEAAEHLQRELTRVGGEWEARLQAELAQAARAADERVFDEAAKVRADAERAATEAVERATREAAERHQQELTAVREEWQARLGSEIAQAHAAGNDALEKVRAEARADIDRLTAEAAERLQRELGTARDVAQMHLTDELARTSAEADQRLASELARVRGEVEQAATESADRSRREMEQALADATVKVREEMDNAAAESTTRLREEMEQAAAHATATLRQEMEQALAAERERAGADLDAERTRLSAEFDGERARLSSDFETARSRAHEELAGERDRVVVELETERVRVRTLTAALEDVRAELAQEKEAARAAAEVIRPLVADVPAASPPVSNIARPDVQAAIVERLASSVRAIASARSLSDTLSALLSSAASVAPRVALFIVNGRELQGWRAAGFGDNSPASLRVSVGDNELLATATRTGVAVSTETAAPPTFAGLTKDRAALAVPIVVGGQSVAVLYADEGGQGSEASTSWPEAIQILGVHASACLAFITAVRTTQAIRATATGSVRDRVATPTTEEDTSARRYARLLVAEIKLYNETAVRVGREKRDLLTRLRPEIERARRLYDERVSPAVAARGAYFQDELVHTLADGDAALLGGNA